jgi:hypothetical protein
VFRLTAYIERDAKRGFGPQQKKIIGGGIPATPERVNLVKKFTKKKSEN